MVLKFHNLTTYLDYQSLNTDKKIRLIIVLFLVFKRPYCQCIYSKLIGDFNWLFDDLTCIIDGYYL